jgi:acetyl esterase/lipase
VLWYGVYDFTNRIGARGKGFVKFLERMVMKAKLADHAELFLAASPMDHCRGDAPPMLIVQGRNDTLVPAVEAAHFAELLRSVSGEPVVYVELPGAQHAFEVFPSVRALHAVRAAARFCNYLWAQEQRRRSAAGAEVSAR